MISLACYLFKSFMSRPYLHPCFPCVPSFTFICIFTNFLFVITQFYFISPFTVSSSSLPFKSDSFRGSILVLHSVSSIPSLSPNQPPVQSVPLFFPGEENSRGVKLTAHLHIVLGLRMIRAITALHAYAIMSRTGTTLPSPSTSPPTVQISARFICGN